MEIVGQPVVLHQSPVFCLIQRNAGKIAVVDQLRSVLYFSFVPFVALTFVLDNFSWNT